MPRTDYEGAWVALQSWIASATRDGRPKTGFGRAELLEKMAEVTAAHQLDEDLLERVARVYGVRTLITMETPPETAAPGEDGSAAPSKPNDPGPPKTIGGHDGNTSRRSTVPAHG